MPRLSAAANTTPIDKKCLELGISRSGLPRGAGCRCPRWTPGAGGHGSPEMCISFTKWRRCWAAILRISSSRSLQKRRKAAGNKQGPSNRGPLLISLGCHVVVQFGFQDNQLSLCCLGPGLVFVPLFGQLADLHRALGQLLPQILGLLHRVPRCRIRP